MEQLKYIILSMRPKQWTKNLFVFAGLLFTLDRKHSLADICAAIIAFILFCMVSGSIYIFNDLTDIRQDRIHPKKSKRPIASGKLLYKTALYASVCMIICAVILSFILNISFGFILLIYTFLMIAYSLLLKDIVILDVLIISSGFVMRAIGGAEVIHVTISPWLLICTTLLALFLGFAKRREELVGLGAEASNHRSCLEHYSISYLDQLLSITAGLTIMSYALYTFLSDTGIKHPGMYFTLVFVIYGVFRYLLMASNNFGVSSPEVLLIKDRPLLINFILWMMTCAVIILH